ncbi:hypothetical protein ACFVYC_10455 [Pseudarthrobacter sp. NPDC058329]|uniref:hypothetical protein n=1 Tax=Pseudarthrobacter sp. NPDC058329 TaxID=3346448 RepID=UPI0036DCAF83
MTNEPTSYDENNPTDTGSGNTAALNAQGGAGSGSKDPTGANPALDDTGAVKAGETGEAPAAPENVEDLDLTPEGLADEPAQQEDPESLAKPENS